MSVDVFERRQRLLAGDEDRVAKQHDAGKMTARERISKLFDQDSFVEIGALAGTQKDAGTVVTGYGLVEDRPVYVYAQDFTVKSGAMNENQAKKIVRVMEMAAKTGSPVVSLCDSNGASLEEGVAALNAYASVMKETAALSGVVPQIALVLGPCAGAASFVPEMGDIVILSEKTGSMFVTGPQVVAARAGKDVSSVDFGGVTLGKGGAAAIVAKDEDEAIAYARKVLSFLPSNNMEDAPLFDADDLNRRIDIDSFVDAHDAIVRIADFNDYVELNRDYAGNIVTAFARIGGRAVGIVANNPVVNDGVLCGGACKKAARFIRLCDCFNLPVVTLVNTCGVKADEKNNASLMQEVAMLIFAYGESVSPKVSVLCGDAIGAAYAAMGSKANGADVVYAWPKAFVAPMDAEAAVRILKAQEIKDGADLNELIESYKAENGALNACENGVCDDVIDPASTRQMIAAALEVLLGKREVAYPRKHGNLPL